MDTDMLGIVRNDVSYALGLLRDMPNRPQDMQPLIAKRARDVLAYAEIRLELILEDAAKR